MTGTWDPESVQRLIKTAFFRVDAEVQDQLLRRVTRGAHQRAELQRADLPTVPPILRGALGRKSAWIVGAMAGELLHRQVLTANGQGGDLASWSVSDLVSAAEALCEEWEDTTCGQLWLMWLLLHVGGSAPALIAEGLLRASGPYAFDAVCEMDSPWGAIDGPWLEDLAAAAFDTPHARLSGSDLVAALNGRGSPEVRAWIAGVETRPDTPGDAFRPDLAQRQQREPEEQAVTAADSDDVVRLAELHERAKRAAQALQGDLEGGRPGRAEDLEVIAELQGLVQQLSAPFERDFDSVTELSEALVGHDHESQLLERLSRVELDGEDHELVEQLRAAAADPPAEGPLRTALVSFAEMLDRPSRPDLDELTWMSAQLPPHLSLAVLASAQQRLLLPAAGSGASPPSTEAPLEAVESVQDPVTDAEHGAEHRPPWPAAPQEEPTPAEPVVAEATDHAEPEDVEDPEGGGPRVTDGDEESPEVVGRDDAVDEDPLRGEDDETGPGGGTPPEAPDPDTGSGGAQEAERPAPAQEDHAAPPIAGVHDDQTPGPPTDLDRDAVGEIVTGFLQQREYGLAYWAAHTGGWSPATQQVLAATGYASALRVSSSQLSERYTATAGTFRLADVSSHRSLQVLALVAATRVALIAPFSGALAVLHEIQPTIDNGSVRTLIDEVIVAANSGLQLGSDLLADVRDRAEVESALVAAAEHARELHETWLRRRAPYQRASRVWRRWLGDNGVFERLTRTAGNDDRARLRWVSEELATLQDQRYLGDLIDTTDLELSGHRAVRRNPIESVARTWLIRNSEELLAAVAAWRDAVRALQQVDDDSIDWQQRILNKLRATVGASGEEALRWLATPSVGASDFALACRDAAGELLQETYDLLLDGTALVGTEPPVDPVMGLDLLRAAHIEFDGGVPRHPEQITLADVHEVVATSWQQAFDARSHVGDHAASSQILKIARWLGPSRSGLDEPAIEALDRRRHELLEADREAVGRLHRACESGLAIARLQRHVDEEAASALEQRLSALTPDPTAENLSTARADLQGFLDDLARHRREAAVRVGDELSALESLIDPDDAGRVRALIEDGQLDTATEFLSLLRSGARIPAVEVRHSHLRAFYPELIDELARQRPTKREINDAIRDRGELAGISFAGLSDDAKHRAQRGVRAWNRLDNGSPSDNLGVLKDVLALIGLPATPNAVTNATGIPSDRVRQWFDVAVSRPLGGGRVYQFGSGAGAGFRIAVITRRPNVVRLLQLIAEDTSRRPLIVLYCGYLTTAERRELAAQLRSDRSRPSILVVDDAVMLYLAAEGSGTFTVPLDCCLPFTGINPYTPYGLGNVPEEMFFGRRRELDSIQDPYGTLFIYGGRQLGKSALLRAAQREFARSGEQRLAAYVDLKAHGIGLVSYANELVDVVVETLQGLGVPLRMPAARPRWGDALVDQTRTWLAEDRDRAILLLLDEADAFLDVDAPQFANVSLLKRLLESTDRAFKPVFAGLHQVQRFMSVPNQPLAHLGEHIEIGPLSPQAAYDLVTAPLDALGYEFESQDVPAKLLIHTNYQPGIIQLFGDALVRHLVRKRVPPDAPPYAVGHQDIDAVYANPGLLEEIRKRFELTISLDPRYRVIAYTMAFAAWHHGPAHQMTPEELRAECQLWWPDGFAHVAIGDFRTLLDELVGLGVLAPTRETRRRSYGIRSPNLLRLLGDGTDIEEQLLEADALELQKRFDITVFHRQLPEGDGRLSPVNEAQLGTLTGRSNRLHIVLGSRAAGVDVIPEVLRDAIRRQPIASYFRSPRKGSIAGRLRSFFEEGEPDAHRVLLNELGGARAPDGPSVLDELREAIDGVQRPHAASTLAVVAIADARDLALWSEILHHPDPTVAASVVELGRWSDASIRMWGEHVEHPIPDGEPLEAFRQVTGGWVTLIERVHAVRRSGVAWDEALNRVSREIRDPEGARRFLDQVGLGADTSFAVVFDELHQVGSGFGVDYLAESLRSVERLGDVDVPEALEVLRALQVTEHRATKTGPDPIVLHLDPVTTVAWQAAARSPRID